MRYFFAAFFVTAMVSVLTSAPVLACDQGFAAFQTTVYAKVMRDCRECHNGSRVGAPPFASQDPMASYNQLVNYFNFTSIEDSLLVFRAGNGHCGKINCQAASGREMASLGQQWWQNGEKSCERSGHFFSAEMPIPNDLPGQNDGFQALNLDLGAIKPELSGVAFQIQIQNFLNATSSFKGAYRVRSPRIIGGNQSVYVKGVKIIIDGIFDSVNNAFDGIDRVFPFIKVADAVGTSTPVLSGEMMIILKDNSTAPKLTVSFVDIGIKEGAAVCLNRKGYESKVQPLLNANACATCHQSAGGSIGEQLLDLNAPAEKQCEAASALVDPDNYLISPLITQPARGLYKHPQFTDLQRYEFVNAVKAWLGK